MPIIDFWGHLTEDKRIKNKGVSHRKEIVGLIKLSGKYKKRPIRFIELWNYEGWKLKVYGISVSNDHPREELVSKAKELAINLLPLPAVNNKRYGVGFIGVHKGEGASFIFVDWWINENELKHHVYVATHENPNEFKYVTPTGLIACCWDLKVLSFERDSWVSKVLNNPSGHPNLNEYINSRLNLDV